MAVIARPIERELFVEPLRQARPRDARREPCPIPGASSSVRAGPPRRFPRAARGRPRRPPRAVGHAHDERAQGRGADLVGAGDGIAEVAAWNYPKPAKDGARTSRATSPSTGTRWNPGGRRTTRTSNTRATRTTASTSCAAHAMSASRSLGPWWPERTTRCCSSRPASAALVHTARRRPLRPPHADRHAFDARTRASRATSPTIDGEAHEDVVWTYPAPWPEARRSSRRCASSTSARPDAGRRR